MPDLFHELPIRAPIARVFHAISAPEGLDTWWTMTSDGQPSLGAIYDLDFGPGYQWQGRVTACRPDSAFELELITSDPDWNGTRVGFHLELRRDRTWVKFHHTGWPRQNQHFRVSNTCWASYLRVLRRYLEYGEQVLYENRLDV
jgi:uncharacterized protein YndB with AHSA1/START domain